jgi:exonuclease SbcC
VALRAKREEVLGLIARARGILDAATEAESRTGTELAALLGLEYPGAELPGREASRAGKLAAEARARECVAAFKALDARRRARDGARAALESTRVGKEEALALTNMARTEAARRRAEYEAASSHAGGENPEPRIAELRRRRLGLEGQLKADLAALEAWSRERNAAQVRLAESEARLPSLSSDCELRRAEALRSLSEAGFPEANAALAAALSPAELSALEGAQTAYDRALAEARAAALEAEKALGTELAPDIAALEAIRAGTGAALDRIQELYDGAKAAMDRFEEQSRRLAALVSERKELELKSRRLGQLSALLSGNIPGRPLPFKNFVLGLYFREIAERASIRLTEMSEGRYSLASEEGSASGRGRVGLELVVRDAYTGRGRPAGTLSGGERFITSLALAFGLADTIRSRSGGVALDAVFVDEGFGSLDEEALDRAIAALDRARGARMIGIVSHVPELRNRIPSRIEVEKGRNGSRIEIV